ncbi:MAG: glycosyltransferase [Flavobacteriales bacterium]|nr:glycosyltransferase [Flavobacteriales bacterium]
MKLSVIIVNYNVRSYLEQCLRSVEEALRGLDGDIYVVDNLSTDGSVEMVQALFPAVKLMANRENVGFSRANNQAIRASDAEYVVLLNPDTVVGEDVFQKAVAFMDNDPKVGGLGVKMIDGTGRFLPESKRGLPTPGVAFFKITGLARLFPRNRIFGRYHLGHLAENEAAPIEILSGACMFLRQKTLEEVGLLDESFFMYGEDIDLSYRITLGGYTNWYLPEARIIHYKGESTKKSSVNYVFVFYNAMAIFARKHFARREPQLFSLLIRAAIYLSAAGAIVVRFLRGALLPMLDFLLIVAAYSALRMAGHFPWPGREAPLLAGALAVLVLALFGAYDLPVKRINAAKGAGALAVVGAALAVVLGGPGVEFVWAWATLVVVVFLVRMMVHFLPKGRLSAMPAEEARILAVGSEKEAREALGLLWQTHYGLGREIVLGPEAVEGMTRVAEIRQLVRTQRMDEVVFCAKDLPMHRVISLMEELADTGAVFKISRPGAAFIIGPSTTESLQDLLVLRDHSAGNAESRRKRRILDVGLAALFSLGLPLMLFVVTDRGGFLHNLAEVWQGRRSWTGYRTASGRTKLPKLRPGVLDIVSTDRKGAAPLTVQRMNLEYAKDYRTWKDLRRVLGHASLLGARPA